MVKKFLREKDIVFEEKDVSADLEAQEEMVEKSGAMVVPILDIDGQIIIGYDKARIEELLIERTNV